MKKYLLIIPFLFHSCDLLFDQGVHETYTFFSRSISNISQVEVYYPDSYTSSTPVIYLLNGWNTEADAWGSGIDLEEEAKEREIMFVSLTAGAHTYTNDPVDVNEQYQDYVLEVVQKVEKNYDIDIDLNRRAICGISNGGGGAIFILSEHPDKFAACGVLSGTYYSATSKFTNLVDRDIRIDVGTSDGVLSEMRFLRNKLNENDLEFEYYEHPGGHNWTFWEKWCPEQFDFLESVISG